MMNYGDYDFNPTSPANFGFDPFGGEGDLAGGDNLFPTMDADQSNPASLEGRVTPTQNISDLLLPLHPDESAEKTVPTPVSVTPQATASRTEEKRLHRLRKNRISAQISRDRKKDELKTLKLAVHELTQQHLENLGQIEKLKAELAEKETLLELNCTH